MYHLGLMRLKSLRVLDFSAFLESSTFASPCSLDRKSTRLNSSHVRISYAVFCLKKKKCLHQVPIFKHLSEPEQQSVSEITYENDYKKGDVIYQAGQFFHTLMFLSQVQVKLYRL